MLQVKLHHAAMLVIAVATLAGCSAEPVAPRLESAANASAITRLASQNTATTDSATVPFTFVQYTSCANGGQGEVLSANGTLEYKGRWSTTAKGERVHTVIHAAFTGTATGWDTGDVYDIVTREFTQTNTSYGDDGIQDSGEELQRIRLRLTKNQPRADFEVILVGRFVQAANGEFVLGDWKATERCN